MSSSMRTKASGEIKICPIEQALDMLGDAWSMLILRDAGTGVARFDDFRKNLSIAPNILTQRLVALTGAGLLERYQYSERPQIGSASGRASVCQSGSISEVAVSLKTKQIEARMK